MIFDMTRRSSGGGGGPSASDAILTVTVPTGSTVTATKGGVTLTPTMWVQAADNTLDCALFVITPAQFDSVNPWTVTATLGTNTKSATVIIDSNEQYGLDIFYALYFIENGRTPYAWVMLGWMTMTETESGLQFKGTNYGHHVGYVDDVFDVTSFNLLIADVTFSPVVENTYYALWDSSVQTPTKDNTAAKKISDSTGHLELDISGLSGLMKIGVGSAYTDISTYTSLYLA